jgi:hypothetical protein
MSNQNQDKGKGSFRGGSHEQPAKAGQQTQKSMSSDQTGVSANAPGATSSRSSVRGGTPQQHAQAGRQSHKNTK